MVLPLMLFAACEDGAGAGVGGENNGTNSGNSVACEHPLSDAWESTADMHWNPTTCEHGEYRGNVGVHVDADEDGNCDVCAYEGEHIHTYSDTWLSDANSHWKVSTCTHKKISFFSAHSDENSDAECDSCGAHVHVVDVNGRCLSCQEQVKVVDTSNMGQVIAALVGGHVNVNGGKITSSFVGRYANSAHSTKSASVIDYSIGIGSIYYNIATAAEVKGADKEGTSYEASTTNYMEKWLSLNEDNSVFGVYRETAAGVTGDFNVDVVTADNLYGHYYSVSTLASGYGAEDVLKALYEKSQDKYSSGFEVEENEGNYKFSFNYTAINKTNTSDNQGNSLGIVTNVNYFEVDVEFSYDADYALTALYINCDCYTNDAGSNLEGDLDIDNIDLEYAAQTGGIIIKEGAKADTYTFTVEQTVGERTYVNEYTKSYFTPSSFEVYSDRDGTIVCPDTVTIKISDYPNDDELSPFVRFRVMPTDEGKIFTDADEITFTSSDNEGLKFASFDPVRKMGSFLAKQVGTYTVTVSVNGTVRTFTVIVEA